LYFLLLPQKYFLNVTKFTIKYSFLICKSSIALLLPHHFYIICSIMIVSSDYVR
uniref:Ovule protein n=1 Tax=Brugia timori TaxID=42155 RepID=A0A0R3QK60_9BILA